MPVLVERPSVATRFLALWHSSSTISTSPSSASASHSTICHSLQGSGTAACTKQCVVRCHIPADARATCHSRHPHAAATNRAGAACVTDSSVRPCRLFQFQDRRKAFSVLQLPVTHLVPGCMSDAISSPAARSSAVLGARFHLGLGFLPRAPRPPPLQAPAGQDTRQGTASHLQISTEAATARVCRSLGLARRQQTAAPVWGMHALRRKQQQPVHRGQSQA